ncbi:MAG: glucose-6-phosphate isomerase, partial [Alphaproteobacteria bacterium]|nr:glucose-6-phosphate isomerase [Alphaproteobacteria bacterium]
TSLKLTAMTAANATKAEAAWSALEREGAKLRRIHLRSLFAENPDRAAQFSVRLDDLLFDFSREKLNADALNNLVALARAAGIEEHRDKMLAGEPVNTSENRAVLHTALRDSRFAPPQIQNDIHNSREQFLAFADNIRSGAVTAADSKPFTQVIHIGMGGSDLGARMTTRALSPDADGPEIRFVSNIDPAALHDALIGIDPARCLVIVSSKTFTTEETLANAQAVRGWLENSLGADAWQSHFAATTSQPARAAEFGVPPEHCFHYGEWVGGRYSVWSAAGLALALAVGRDAFLQFLRGAAAMDNHFHAAPLHENLPVLFALVGVWRRNIMGWPMVALVPYDERLENLAAYVQQLEMESNGKSVTREGRPVRRATSPVFWGGAATGVQHAFFQLLHQGTDIVPADMILARHPRDGAREHHQILQAHCLAQTRALAFGRSAEEVRDIMLAAGSDPDTADRLAPHRRLQGDRPSSVLLHDRLDAFSLGRLVALFEHRAFVTGCIWGINSFDQWGVELGKEIASALLPLVRGEDGDTAALDSATLALLSELGGGE